MEKSTVKKDIHSPKLHALLIHTYSTTAWQQEYMA
jgi:acid stress-induced BolA-like protein IbaG/YrbA